LLFIGIVTALTSCVLGCTCLPGTFEEFYGRADSVVSAKVLDVKKSGPCTGLNCIPAVGTFTYTLGLYEVFKGCGPRSRTFFAKSSVQSAACGVTLKKGDVYMLNLPQATYTRPPTGPTVFYNLNICQGHRLWSSLTKCEIYFLRYSATLKENQCPH